MIYFLIFFFLINKGGAGMPVQLRVTDCAGPTCELVVGKSYVIEGDFIPSAAADQISVKLVAIDGTVQVIVVDEPVPNSAIKPGEIYTISYTLSPTDAFVGKTITLQLSIRHTATDLLEICVGAPATIVPA
jgi:hypothetical protein